MPYTMTPDAADDAAAHILQNDALTLLGDGLALALAVTLGGMLARCLRRRGLHWSWSALSLAAALPLAGLLGRLGPGVAIALLVASLRGRRWHRGDLDAGHDLAQVARERLTPATVLRRRLTLGRLPTPHALAGRRRGVAAAEVAERTLRLGRDSAGRVVAVPFAPDAAGHALVVGATGSGKTVTQTLFAVRAIEQGRGVVVIDPKGDAALRRAVGAAAATAGRELIEWSPDGPTAYNPYARGGETEIADRLLAGERFTEPHYLRQAQRYLGHAVRALRACEVEVSLRTIVEMLEPAALEELLRRSPQEKARAGHAYLDSLTARQLRDLAGVRDRLAILAESDAGGWLDPGAGDGDVPAGSAGATDTRTAGPTGTRASFDLLEAVGARAVVYFALDADSRPLLAQMLGAAIVQDLQSTVAALQTAPVATLVVIDEFAAVSAEHVVALFGRARSAGVSLLLGTQEIADLRLPGRERMLEQVLGNLSLLLAHRQVVPASAELVSRLSGARGTWRVSRSSSGLTTRTRASEPCIASERLSRLAPGWAAVIPFGSGDPARVTRIEARSGEQR